jgi:hypothetical protein
MDFRFRDGRPFAPSVFHLFFFPRKSVCHLFRSSISIYFYILYISHIRAIILYFPEEFRKQPMSAVSKV